MSTTKLAQLASSRRALNSLVNFLIPALPFLNSHLNNFFAKSLWNVHFNEKLKSDLENISLSQLKNYARNLADAQKKTRSTINTNEIDVTFIEREQDDINFQTSSLQDIIQRIEELLLLSVPLSPDELQTRLMECSKNNLNEDFLKLLEEMERTIQNSKNTELVGNFDPFMSKKKLHEVEVLSELITRLSTLQYVKSSKDNSVNLINYLVDVGSGKGYLSSFMMLMYHFKVLAIDSQAVNSVGCTKRATKLQKNWSAFMKRAQERRDGTLSKPAKYWRLKNFYKQDSSGIETDQKEKKEQQQEEQEGQLLTQNENNLENSNSEVPTICDPRTVSQMRWQKTLDELNKNLKSLTLYVTENMKLSELLKENFNEEKDVIDQHLKSESESISSNTNDNNNINQPFGLVGLHTCGPLGTDSVRLFEKNKEAKFLCNVPCCYHLLEESYCEEWEKYSVVGKQPLPHFAIDNPSFPLSQMLHEKKFYLGRNPRMMSAHTLHRMSIEENDEVILPQTFVYRVILEALIYDKLGHNLLEYPKVGRNVGAKCKDFTEYVRKCLEKMHLTKEIEISDTEIEEFYRTHQAEQSKLYKYFLFRNFFANLIERCILLDRLVYLLENEADIEEASMVQVFDPFLSPRCLAIVALRRT